MGRTVPTFRQWLNAECQEWMKMKTFLPEQQRKALRELLDAALQRSDAGSIVPRPLPSETMFMLMLVHLSAKINELEEEVKERTEKETQSILSRSLKARSQQAGRREWFRRCGLALLRKLTEAETIEAARTEVEKIWGKVKSKKVWAIEQRIPEIRGT
jgi:hypothetical protein